LYPLQGKGIEPSTAKALEAAARAQIGDMRSFRLFGAGQTEAVIAPPGGLGLSCGDGRAECLASLGRLLGAAVVVFGEVAAERSELRLVDVKTSVEVRRVSVSVPQGGGAGDALREAVVSLLAPEKYTGSLEVIGQHGRLAIDNSDRSDLPVAGLLPLPVGRHQITITLPGHTSWNTLVEIRYQQVAHVDGTRAPSPTPEIVYTPEPVDIPESHPAPHPERGMSLGRKLSYAAFTAAVIGGAAGIVCGAISADNASALQGQSRPIPLSEIAEAAQQAARARDFGLAADVVWGTAAVLGVAGVVLYLVSPEHAPEAEHVGQVEVSGAGALVRF